MKMTLSALALAAVATLGFGGASFAQSAMAADDHMAASGKMAADDHMAASGKMAADDHMAASPMAPDAKVKKGAKATVHAKASAKAKDPKMSASDHMTADKMAAHP